MNDDLWRQRLQAELDRSERSARDVSRKAGKGPGYLHSILKEGKDPTIDSLIAVCRELNISVTKIIYGFELSPGTELLLSLIENNPDKREAILSLLDPR